MKKILLMLLSTLILGISSSAMAEDGLQIRDLWVRAAPPTVQTLAAYMVIENTGKVGKTLVGAQSPSFHRVEFHETINRNGMASMVARDSLVIDAGSKVTMQPGGYHMMLIAPQILIKEGDKVSFTFLFSDGSHKSVEATVKKDASESSDAGHSMNQMDHMQHMQNMPMGQNMPMDHKGH